MTTANESLDDAMRRMLREMAEPRPPFPSPGNPLILSYADRHHALKVSQDDPTDRAWLERGIAEGWIVAV